MKKLVLYVINAIPALAISYRPGIFVDYLPVGEAYYKRTYHKLTGSSIVRLLCLSHNVRYVVDEKTGTEITILEMKGGK